VDGLAELCTLVLDGLLEAGKAADGLVRGGGRAGAARHRAGFQLLRRVLEYPIDGGREQCGCAPLRWRGRVSAIKRKMFSRAGDT